MIKNRGSSILESECAICRNNKAFDMPEELIEAATNGDLVLFCGAGISTENRLVLPETFYESVKEEMGIDNKDISFSELMELYCEQPNGRKKLLKKISDRFHYIQSFPEIERQATMFHAELKDIYQIRTIITTNWDNYFEDYCDAMPITIPEDFTFWDEKSRFVLKIHGSFDNLSSVVATKQDYDKCLERLQNGIIGATLKNILVTKTVVFIGFSFGDDDLNMIIDYLRNELGDLYPHIYYVSLDESLKDRLMYKNSTSIVTSGVFFIHCLKEILTQKGLLCNMSSEYIIKEACYMIEMLHKRVSEISLKDSPCVIYTLAYQDGVIHAWERYLKCKTGEYNRPNHVVQLIYAYEKEVDKKKNDGNYWDSSYFQGYLEGLSLIEICDKDPDAVKVFPFLFLPNAKRTLDSFDVYMDELKRVSNGSGKYVRYAKQIVRDKGDEVVVHHPPY